MATIHKINPIRTKPTLLQRIKRHDATASMLVVLWLFAFCALAELACWLLGAGRLGPIGLGGGF